MLLIRDHVKLIKDFSGGVEDVMSTLLGNLPALAHATAETNYMFEKNFIYSITLF